MPELNVWDALEEYLNNDPYPIVEMFRYDETCALDSELLEDYPALAQLCGVIGESVPF